MILYGNPVIHGDTELRKLFESYQSLCREVWDPKVVPLGPSEWAEEITIGVLRIATAEPESEYAPDTKFRVGYRVRRRDGITGLATQDGEVVINSAWVVKNNNFRALEAEGLDISSLDVENMEHLAELVMVRWYAPDGGVICEGWHDPESLELKAMTPLPDYLIRARDAIQERDRQIEEATKRNHSPVQLPTPRKYKLWKVLALSEESRREFMEHPEEWTPYYARYNNEQNGRFNALVEAHIKKHGKLPSNVTRWNDPAPTAASLRPKEKQITQGGAVLVGRRLSSYAKKKIYWLWQDRIPFGSLCTIAGDPDEGKSLITLYVAARVSRGEKLYDNSTDTEPAEVLILSAEDDPETTLRPRLEAAGANLGGIHLLESVVLKDARGNKSERIAQLDSDIAMIGAYLDLYPQIKVVIIDPVSSFLGSASMNKEQEVRRVLQPLANRARESGLAVVMVAHFNKNSETRSAMDRVGGAKAIVGMGRAAWTCVREPEKEQQAGESMPMEGSDRRLFLKLKGNLAPSKIGGLVYTIKTAPVEVEGKDGPVTVDVPYIVWLEKTDYTAQGVVIGDGKGKPGKASKVELAKDWLRSHLESVGGFAPVHSIERAGLSDGHNARNLRYAKGQLGLRQEWVARDSYWALKGVKISPQLDKQG